MHWEKASSSSIPGRTRPYQGVRVRDPVKELLRKKRSLERPNSKTLPTTADMVALNNQISFPQGFFGADVAEATATDGGQQCVGWKAIPPSVSGAGPQTAATPWCSSDYSQQEPTAQTGTYPTSPALTADIYMQTLCPSYTMLTYAHTPLLTNFGTIPVAPAPAALPQLELPDSQLTYFPWAQSLTTISTLPSQGVQFTQGAVALPAPSLVHMPVSMSLTTMIPQTETQGSDPHPQFLDLPRDSDQQPDLEPPGQNTDSEVEAETPNLLDRLLEDREDSVENEAKESYSSSFFISDV